MKLQAQWIVGFADGVGDFSISIHRDGKIREGYRVLAEFSLTRREQDAQVLYALKSFFACGVVRKTTDNAVAYRVREHGHLTKIIIPFFEKHELKTKTGIKFRKFRKILLKIEKIPSLDPRDLEEIQNLKSQMESV